MKAKISKLDGTIFEFEGTVEEIQKVLCPDKIVVDAPLTEPYTPPLFVSQKCQDGCEYPTVWHGIFPPPCKKCGCQLLAGRSITISTNSSGESIDDDHDRGIDF